MERKNIWRSVGLNLGLLGWKKAKMDYWVKLMITNLDPVMVTV